MISIVQTVCKICSHSIYQPRHLSILFPISVMSNLMGLFSTAPVLAGIRDHQSIKSAHR